MPLAAQDSDPLRGVWRGNIGDLPVHACLKGSEARGVDGVYYYDRHLQPIALEADDDAFAERIGWDEPGDARWQIESVSDDELSGRWSDGARGLPIRLESLGWQAANELSDPCESAEFMNPRLQGGSVRSQPADINGQAYTQLHYAPPSHFSDEMLQISTFALIEEQRGDRAINYALAYDLPQGDVGDAFADCFAMHIAFRGVDGDFYKFVRPEILTPRWLGVLENNSLYCGGAHPSHWTSRRVFDRNEGVEVDPLSWLNDGALSKSLLSSGADTIVYITIGEALNTVLVAHWPMLEGADSQDEQEHFDECRNLASQTDTWDIGLAKRGLAFIPGFPHAMMACAETVEVPWHQLTPFLSLQGQAAMESLARE